MKLLIVAMAIRTILAYWNVNISPIFGSEYDAKGFHEGAISISNGMHSSYSIEQSYMYFLGYVYRFTGIKSQFFGSTISCVAWMGSAIVLMKIFDELDVKKIKFFWISIYATLPSTILYASLTMREPFMLLLINLIALCILNIYKKNKIYSNIFLITLCCIILYLLNISFITTIIFLLISSLIVRFTKNNCSQYVALMTILTAFGYFYLNIHENNYLHELIELINNRQEHFQRFARASYINTIISNTYLSQAKFIFISFANYMTQPIDLHRMILKDYILLYENLIRLIMFILSIFGLIKAMLRNNIWYVLLFFTYLMIELTWASYTINWGTAARHHMASFGILTILSIYSMSIICSQKKI